ncbi:MAG: RluA family pseudouridine synthase [Eubacterium sp.]|nr:RluA family pseudouridine synthase [Eubacterium sp.]
MVKQKRGDSIDKFYIRIKDEEAGIRLDQILTRRLDGLSRSHIQHLFELGNIRVNGEQCKAKNRKPQAGDQVELVLPDPVELDIKPENIPLDIIYEDEDVLVVNKPYGMVVHPAVGNYTGTLVNAIMYHCGDSLSSINGVVRPGIVHRIDKDTSGLLMVAKNDSAHLSLSTQLAAHSITRKYMAIVMDNFRNDEGTVDLPIGRDPRNRLKKSVNGLNAKDAVTHYKVLERFGEYTLVECQLETGRTHQIRVHMAYIKHPLVGDPVYGSRKPKFQVHGQMLHAGTLGFIHPTTGEQMLFTAPPPKEFQELLQVLRGRSGKRE